MKYRPEIDGLRAVAVIAVIFFHAGFKSFRGGFVGVDVFFVISGYLITTILLTEKDQGGFSLVNFYERRARRILPALFLVVFVSLIYAWFWLLPTDMKDFSQSLIAVSTFSSNILFWQTSGYWDTTSELKPLLHTWSLAVEEQYYLFFPLFLMLVWRYRRRWIFVSFMGVAIASLSAAQWGAYNEPTASFYLLPTRLWELAIGAGIAFIFLYKGQEIQSSPFIKNLSGSMSLLGLAMIGYAVFFFDEGTPFPSLYGLLPTIGAGLIVFFASSGALVRRLLGAKPVVSVGLISYSAYLWHQPLFAFYRLQSPIERVGADLWLGIFLAFALAYLSWRFVENPFRDRNKISRKTVFSFAIVGSLSFIAIGIAGYQLEGFEYRLTTEQKYLMAFDDYDIKDIYREGVCQLDPDQKGGDFSKVCFPAKIDDNTILVWGDSHAGALSYGLREAHPGGMFQLTSSGCPPIIGFSTELRPNCQNVNNFILNKIGEMKPGFVILHANWSDPIDAVEPGLSRALIETIEAVKLQSPDTQIIVVGGAPQWRPTLPKVLLKSHVKLETEAYVFASGYDRVSDTDIILRNTAEFQHIAFISLLEHFCRDKECLSSVKFGANFEPFAWDYGHLTQSSSILVARYLLNTIQAEP